MKELSARVRLARARFELDIDLRLQAHGVSALFGPSGAGKSTLLRILAGLEPTASGRVALGDEVWQDTAAGHFVPPHRRSIGYVFQDAELFGHLDVRRNLEYGYRRATAHRISLDQAVGWLGLERILGRRSGGLSGGERQRVAIGRALLSSPRLLLMDEPLSSLDEVSRQEILPYIEALAQRLSIPILYVSHSLREVLRLADQMVWMENGRIASSGAPAEVVRGSAFAAWQGERASVLVEATVEEHDEEYHLTRMAGPWGPIYARRHPAQVGELVRVQIYASDVSLSLSFEAESSILNQFDLEVVQTEEGDSGDVLLTLAREGTPDVLRARVTRLSCTRLGIRPGSRVCARVKSIALVD